MTHDLRAARFSFPYFSFLFQPLYAGRPFADGLRQSERMTENRLIACPDCDVLLRKPLLRNRQVARCPRCGATLYRGAATKLDRLAAIALGALITFAIAQSFPVIALDANGITSQTSLMGALVVLWGEHMQFVAAIVFCSTILFPLTELLALLYVLLPVRRGRVPPGFSRVLRVIQLVRPWGMLEVFLLGALVTIVKMADLARVIPGTALFAFGALTLMLAIVATFDARTLWDIADGLRAQKENARRGSARARAGRVPDAAIARTTRTTAPGESARAHASRAFEVIDTVAKVECGSTRAGRVDDNARSGNPDHPNHPAHPDAPRAATASAPAPGDTDTARRPSS